MKNSNVKVVAPLELLDSATGDPAILAMADEHNRKKAVGYNDGTNVTFEVSQELMVLDEAKYAVSKGADVLDFRLHIEIDDENDLVPIGVTGAEYEDEEGETINRTWSEWLASSSYVVERDGRKFVGTQCCVVHRQGLLPMSQLVPVFGQLIKTKDLPETTETV